MLLIYLPDSCAQNLIWTKEPTFINDARDDAASFSINNIGYVGTGFKSNLTNSSDFYKYQPTTKNWQQVADFPGGPRQYACAFSYGKYGYICSGSGDNGIYYKDLWQYDSENDSWKKLSDMPGIERNSAQSFLINNSAYICGGFNPVNGILKDVWKYDVEKGEWTQSTDLPIELRLGTAFSLNGKGYVGTGLTNNSEWTNKFWSIETLHNNWTEISSANEVAKTYVTGFAYEGYGYLVGGMDTSFNCLNECLQFCDTTNTWKKILDIDTQGIKGSTAFITDSGAYIVCGIKNGNVRTNSNYRLQNTTIAKLLKSENNFGVYPNPSNGYITIFAIKDRTKNFVASLYTLVGQKLLTEESSNTSVLNLNGLSVGCYILQISQGDILERKKIILE